MNTHGTTETNSEACLAYCSGCSWKSVAPSHARALQNAAAHVQHKRGEAKHETVIEAHAPGHPTMSHAQAMERGHCNCGG